MQILKQFPPNFAKIEYVFPKIEDYKPVFSYGDIIYNPYNIEVTKDLEIHEEVHSKQQGGDPENWWNKYLEDKNFRLSQEIEAYGTQYAFLKKHIPTRFSDFAKEDFAKSISSELYGNLLSYYEAESRIRHYAKNI